MYRCPQPSGWRRGRAGQGKRIVEDTEQNIVSAVYNAVYEATPRSPTLQRLWRDVHVASHHAITEWQVNLEVYGKALLGVEPNITHLI